jgi:hypothetical protein
LSATLVLANSLLKPEDSQRRICYDEVYNGFVSNGDSARGYVCTCLQSLVLLLLSSLARLSVSQDLLLRGLSTERSDAAVAVGVAAGVAAVGIQGRGVDVATLHANLVSLDVFAIVLASILGKSIQVEVLVTRR